MINAGRFQLAGFDRDDNSAPTWLPDDSFEEVDDALEAATAQVGAGLSARVDVIQVQGGTGHVVRVVTSDGVEVVDKVRRDLNDDVERSLSAAGRSVVAVGLATITRSLATTNIESAMTAKAATQSLERTFGTMLWSEKDTSRSNARHFEHFSADVQTVKGFHIFMGVNCRGTFEDADGTASLRLTFRPTWGAVLSASMLLTFTVLSTLAATFPARSGAPPNRWLYVGTLLFGAMAWDVLRRVQKHRRQTDVAFLDALEGADSKLGRGRKDRRPKTT